ncbi:ABC transporter permease subunit [Gorillibacterium sp. CAU 1737]|uniref:ABC transporter permease n=1 Tax=Gorillibacterium sp. CAU 1737 TaxID=3140362 RepID=UPI00325FEBCA
MLNLMKGEWARMMARTKTKVILILYFLAVLFICVFLKAMGTGMVDITRSFHLDELNLSPYLLRELSILLNFLLIPMLAADSFNGEYTSGAYRMMLLRPVSHARLVTAKWLVQALMLLALTLVTGVVGTAFGRLFLPSAETTQFLGMSPVGPGKALAYTVVFYLIFYLVELAVLALAAFFSTIAPHPILAYACTVCGLIGAMYVSDRLSFLFSSSDAIFALLGGEGGTSMLVVSALCVMMAYSAVLLLWKKRDWRQ